MANCDYERYSIYLTQRIANIELSLEDCNIRGEDDRAHAHCAIGECQDLLGALKDGDDLVVASTIKFLDDNFGVDIAVWYDNHPEEPI